MNDNLEQRERTEEIISEWLLLDMKDDNDRAIKCDINYHNGTFYAHAMVNRKIDKSAAGKTLEEARQRLAWKLTA